MQRAVCLLLAQALLAGCYTYTPVEAAAEPAGTSLRVRLTAASAPRIMTPLGSPGGRVISGNVVDHDKGAVTLQVQSVASGTPEAQQGLFQRVTLAPTDILETERRTLDRTRTGVLVGAVAAAVVTTVVVIAHGQSTGSSAVVEPPGQFVRRPTRPIVLFRF